MSGWKFVGEFRRGRKAPFTLECFVAISNLEEARMAAATKLVGADAITEEQISKAELVRRDVKKGEAAFR